MLGELEELPPKVPPRVDSHEDQPREETPKEDEDQPIGEETQGFSATLFALPMRSSRQDAARVARIVERWWER